MTGINSGAAFGVPLFRISVYNKDRQFECNIGNPSSLEAVIRWDQVSTLTMSLPLGHKRVPNLMADGARLRVLFRGEHLISGPIVSDSLESSGGKDDTYTVTVEDDVRVLKEILGWPVPTAGIISQDSSEYRTYTGNAESIVKAAVTENGVNRLAIPGLTVAPNLNRGATVPGGVPFRFHPLAEQLFPAVTDAGIGVTVRQVDGSLVLDVREPEQLTTKLSVKGRTLKRVGMTRTRPAASRVVIGGQGEGTARKFRMLTDPLRESQYEMRAEAFRDARDDDTDAVMDARGQETLREQGPKNGVSIDLAGSGIFQYGPGGFHVGDSVPIEVTGGVTMTEVIRECTLRWKSAHHADIEPSAGEITNQPERAMANRFAAMFRRIRNQETR
ncbi:ReqiPepy6 Gp37-like protein [Arthrobacter sp. SLBN-83]|uniref:Gp37-like protein n=1 Tax=Arthrobacter sp. SLBN-83 TaxID=2768449 RepID=UPI00116DB790|nr:hypothetical protein [Arthrobacter sp. SLBN-83]TQJ60476.1 ReqiPepy6 Gp37-like protein [Arthrobacter sp. SLBN-83]